MCVLYLCCITSSCHIKTVLLLLFQLYLKVSWVSRKPEVGEEGGTKLK